MTPKDANANDQAIEALVAASLREPDKETELTEEETCRYVDQRVTLSLEDEEALRKSKAGVIQKIADILQVGKTEKADRDTSKPKTTVPEESSAEKRNRASEEFIEAVVIAQITRLHSSPEHPLGRKRYQKLAYLAHRKTDDDVTQHYLKKAAGPYSPWARYQGPENIALKNCYVKRVKVDVYEGLVVGTNIDQIETYLPRYPVCNAIEWVITLFRWRRNDDLELLTTVDFAVLDLNRASKSVSVNAVKEIIATSKEWKAKLKREIFSDFNIAGALDELRTLFPATYEI
ncbi:MAG: hypothetical protein ACREIF_14275 [Chthoniobacterales bacterium]